MTVHYGFFNSSNGDRVYDAEDFSRFFDGIIFDGVYSAVGNRFNVEAVTGMYITVDTGRAWFDHTWTFNDQKLTLELQTPDTVYNRIDAVVIEVNKDQRKNFIKTVEGTPAENPARPVLTKTDTIIQYALAYIEVNANAENIEQTDITYVVDTSETPLCSALNLAGLPSGGGKGHVLAKASYTSGDVGWYNVNQLPVDDWYLPTGVSQSDVIAAYRFKGATSRASACNRVNTSGTAYNLSPTGNNVTWSAENGFFIPATYNAGLENSTLRGLTWGTVAVKYSNAQTGDVQVGLVHKDGITGLYANYEMSSRKANQDYNWDYFRFNKHYPAMTNGVSLSTQHKYSATPGENQTAGIVSCYLTNLSAMYFNGISCSLSSVDSNASNLDSSLYSTAVVFGNSRCTASSKPVDWGSVFIHAAVIYNRELTATETVRLHQLMAEL